MIRQGLLSQNLSQNACLTNGLRWDG